MNCIAPKEEPGGGGINVARAIHKLGGDAMAIYVSGGCTGKKFDQLLKDENIPALIIPGLLETGRTLLL